MKEGCRGLSGPESWAKAPSLVLGSSPKKASQSAKSHAWSPTHVQNAHGPRFTSNQYLSVTGLVHSKYTRARTLNTYLSRRSRPLNHSTHRLTHCSHMHGAHTLDSLCARVLTLIARPNTQAHRLSHTYVPPPPRPGRWTRSTTAPLPSAMREFVLVAHTSSSVLLTRHSSS